MSLQARNVRFSHGPGFTLDLPAFDLAPGETAAAVGPNGAGKSTLLRVLAGLLFPFAGDVSLDGLPLDPRDPVPHRRRIGFVFARPVRFRGTVLENAAAGLRARGAARGEAQERARAWLERAGLGGRADSPASELSDGEFQRVALVRALVSEPEYLFLDEPFARFDPVARAAWAEEIARLAGGAGRGVLLVTQEPAEAARLAKRVLVLDRGAVVQQGPPAELRDRPASPVVAAFFPRG